jgi:hypothetical protein
MRNEKENIEKIIKTSGFKVYLGKSPLDCIIFSPKGEKLGGILDINIVYNVNNKNDILPKINLTSIVNIITEEEKNELLKINKKEK